MKFYVDDQISDFFLVIPLKKKDFLYACSNFLKTERSIKK